MIARIQQAAVLLWGMVTIGLLWHLGRQGPDALNVAALSIAVLAMPMLLAAQFLLMALTHAGHHARLERAVTGVAARRRPGGLPGGAAILQAYCRELGAAVRVFAWQQPFRAASQPDTDDCPDMAGRGVVLIHGFACNRGLWLSWLQRLRTQRRVCVAVTLEPPWGPIERYIRQVEDAVARVERRTGLAPVLVAHSMGGLAARAWWATTRPERVHRLITLGTPHHGTVLASFALAPNARQMRRGSPWLAALAQADGPARRARMSCFWSWCDNIVFPADTACLEGAANHGLRNAAHVHMLWHPQPWAELQRWLVGAPAAG